MRTYKYVMDGFIVLVGTGTGFSEISTDEHEQIIGKLQNHPGENYHLRDSDKEWVYVEQEVHDEPDSE